MYKIPIGVDNFHKLITGGYLFCDKTAMIADFLSKGEDVTLITRPRRWGKTLNMSMLYHFLAPEVDGIPTAGFFDGLEIGKLEGGSYLKNHQGKHPVIMLSFKDVHADNFEGAVEKVRNLIQRLFISFAKELVSSTHLIEDEKEIFKIILSGRSNVFMLEDSLLFLGKFLYKHHGQKVYMLIDEYDTPLNQAYGNKEYLQ